MESNTAICPPDVACGAAHNKAENRKEGVGTLPHGALIVSRCLHCQAILAEKQPRRGPKRKYCSQQCSTAARAAESKFAGECEFCGAVITGRRRKFCDNSCFRKNYHRQHYTPHPSPVGVRDKKDDLIAMYQSGRTLKEIGQKHGVTRERVRQIIKQYGITRADGGVAVRKAARLHRNLDRMNRRMLEKRGMPRADFVALNDPARWGGYSKTPIAAFLMQQRNAKERGVAFNFIFADWWKVWTDSGKWVERGRAGDSYVMCRVNDEGAYELGNVYIDTLRNNSAFGRKLAHKRPKEATEACKVIRAAGGIAAVSKATGMSRTYITNLANRGHFPKSWVVDGRASAIAALTAGAYSDQQVFGLSLAS